MAEPCAQTGRLDHRRRLTPTEARPNATYRLIGTDGDDLGSLRAAVPSWIVGERIYHGRSGDLLVVGLVAAEPGDEVPGISSSNRLRSKAGRGAVRSGYAREAVPETIELLYWEGCPSYPEARALLDAVLATRGLEVPITMREVRTQDEADELRFPGSPTIRIDGADVDPAGAEGRPSLTCRIYRLPDGRISPIPSMRQLEEALA